MHLLSKRVKRKIKFHTQIGSTHETVQLAQLEDSHDTPVLVLRGLLWLFEENLMKSANIAYFEFTVPTSAKEFVAWRKATMARYNPKRAALGMDEIQLDGYYDTFPAPDDEISPNGLP